MGHTLFILNDPPCGTARRRDRRVRYVHGGTRPHRGRPRRGDAEEHPFEKTWLHTWFQAEAVLDPRCATPLLGCSGGDRAWRGRFRVRLGRSAARALDDEGLRCRCRRTGADGALHGR